MKYDGLVALSPLSRIPRLQVSLRSGPRRGMPAGRAGQRDTAPVPPLSRTVQEAFSELEQHHDPVGGPERKQDSASLERSRRRQGVYGKWPIQWMARPAVGAYFKRPAGGGSTILTAHCDSKEMVPAVVRQPGRKGTATS